MSEKTQSPVAMMCALWLDPQGLPSQEAIMSLNAAGLQPLALPSMGELRVLSHHRKLVVVKLTENTLALQNIIQAMRTVGIKLPVICRVDAQKLSLGVRAMQEGALHVLAAEDWSLTAWREAVGLMNTSTLAPLNSVVFVDPLSLELLALARRVAQAGVTTLLTGPTGAGKEVMARLLHDASVRSTGPFVGVNCSALPESMIEDILFGHEKGAFTGAAREHAGVFEQAHGGTLFLDEVAEIPFALQSKLLRVIQERQVSRLGSQQSIHVDVRLVTATNKDLRAAMQAREFREDLYFRISTFRLRVPALNERPGDILPLAKYLLQYYAPSGRDWYLTPAAEKALLAYSWPGNVRELSNVMQRALVLSEAREIDVTHLLFEEMHQAHPSLSTSTLGSQFLPHQSHFAWGNEAAISMDDNVPVNQKSSADLGSMVRDSEYKAIVSVLQKTPNRIKAAEALGISPRTLRYKLARFKELGLVSAEMN